MARFFFQVRAMQEHLQSPGTGRTQRGAAALYGWSGVVRRSRFGAAALHEALPHGRRGRADVRRQALPAGALAVAVALPALLRRFAGRTGPAAAPQAGDAGQSDGGARAAFHQAARRLPALRRALPG